MPSLRLFLLRHAKSAWESLELSDHARPLNARGRRSCAAIGHWLRAHGYVPDQVLCSTATRTRETWDLVSAELPEHAAISYHQGLYHAEPRSMRDHLDGATGQAVMMIGHNPGMAAFAAELAQRPPDHPKFEQFPTAAVLVLSFDAASWSSITPRSGTVVDFTVPRDLPDPSTANPAI